MDIEKIWFHQLPTGLEGHAVVVDVFAASTNMSILLSKAPRRLVVVNESNLQGARQLYRDSILVGESTSLEKQEFFFSNSLKDMYSEDVKGRSVLWMSINGSRVFEKSMNICTGEVLAGSFVNSLALAHYLRTKPQKVFIIIAGDRGVEVEEDRICGEVLERRLLGQPVNWEDVMKKASSSVRNYYPEAEWEIDLPYLVDHIDDLGIVPRCIRNTDGFLEVVDASRV